MSVKTLGMIAVVAVTMSGCYVRGRATVRAPAVVVTEDDYEPEYYDDYIVYYNDRGDPYYYADGRVVYIASTHPRYRVYVNHYRSHRAVYSRWEVRHRNDRYHRRGQWRPRRRR